MILEEPLMRRGVVGLDEGLMLLLQLGRGTGQGEPVVIQSALHIKVRLHPVLLALALHADDRLMPDLEPCTDGLKVGRRIRTPCRRPETRARHRADRRYRAP